MTISLRTFFPKNFCEAVFPQAGLPFRDQHGPSLHKSTPKPLPTVPKDFISLVIDCFQEINQAMIAKKDANAEPKDGVWYPHDYVDYYDNKAKFSVDSSEVKRCQEKLKTFRENEYFFGFTEAKTIKPTIVTVQARTTNFCFELRIGSIPSAALDDMKTRLTILDCGSALSLAILDAFRKYVGAEKFNNLFSSRGFCVDTSLSPLRAFLKYIHVTKKSAMQVGDLCYLHNPVIYSHKHPAYHDRHPTGHAVGFNVICAATPSATVTECSYLGFGLPKVLSHSKIQQFLVDDYNRPPVPPTHVLTQKGAEKYNYTTPLFFLRDLLFDLKLFKAAKMKAFYSEILPEKKSNEDFNGFGEAKRLTNVKLVEDPEDYLEFREELLIRRFDLGKIERIKNCALADLDKTYASILAESFP